MTASCLAIVPARGGSKGVPRKNLHPLAGLPLIAHAVLTARAAKRVDRVVVSTDDDEIAETAQMFGAEVVMRPAELAGDRSASELALLHTLDFLKQSEGYVPDLMCFVQCTSPLTLPEDIDGAVVTFEAEAADSLLTVTPFYHFLWRREADGCAAGINHDPSFRPMRQEREGQFLETGSFYLMRTEGFLAARYRFFGRTAMHVLPPERAPEIDTLADFAVVEQLMRQQGRARQPGLPPKVSALVCDFDGVFTDNRVIVLEDGREAVVCSRGDGMGFDLLRKTGLPVLVLSKEANSVVSARCRKLKIPVIQSCDDKPSALAAWARERGIPLEEIVYVGNDVNDLGCMRMVGCAVVVADAHPDVLPAAHIVLNHPGGQGALRELCDRLVAALGAA